MVKPIADMQEFAVEKINQKILKANAGSAILVMLPGESYKQIASCIVKTLAGLKKSGMLITFNNSYDSYIKNPENNDFYCIDMVSRSLGVGDSNVPNVKMVSSPSNLTELGIIFSQISNRLSADSNKFVVFDSISTLNLYNSQEISLRFMHFLVNKIRLQKMRGIFLVPKDSLGETAISKMSQFFDAIEKV